MGAPIMPPEPPSKGRGTNNTDRVLALVSMMASGPVMLLVDTNASGVLVPTQVRAQHGAALPLLIAWNQFLQVPIPDLLIDDKGIRATLSFGGPFRVRIPWTAIWRVYSEERNILYGEHVPAGLVAAVQNHKQPTPVVVPPVATKPVLSLVPMPGEDETVETPQRPSGEWPALRLVPPLPDEPTPPSVS